MDRNLGYNHIICYSDSQTMIDLIFKDHTPFHFYALTKVLDLVLGVCCNNLTKKMMNMNMMKCAHKFQRLLYILIVGKMLLHLKPEKFNDYACKTQSAWGCHTNL